MMTEHRSTGARAVACGLAVLFVTGCGWFGKDKPAAAPMGALSDPIWRMQEEHAERSDFVIYQHEFKRDAEWLNTGGEDHVKQIAYRLLSGHDAQVVVERSMTASRPDTEFQYPVHPDPKLDLRRREIIVRSLVAMGVTDADQRVLVAPALTPGLTGNEAESAYYRGVGDMGRNSGMGYSGGFGGFMFRGGY
jgi:hypothetical protein